MDAALGAGADVHSAIMTGEALAEARGAALSARLNGQGCPVFEVPAGIFGRLSRTEAPQGVALVCMPRRATLEEAIETDLLVVADRIQDPGNLGAILRSSLAFGAGAVLTTRGTVEMFNPKVLRASAGTWPGLRLVEGLDAGRLSEALATRKFRLLIADSAGKRDFREPVWGGAVALVIGSEARGADRLLAAGSATSVRIPMKGGVESLNAAAAAAVLLAEAFRARQLTGGGVGDRFH